MAGTLPTTGFGSRLREAREAAELTQEGLGQKIERTGAAISQWERGENFPDSLELLLLLPDALNVTFMWLFYGRGEKNPIEGTDMSDSKLALIAKIRKRLPDDKVGTIDQIVEAMSPPESEAPVARPTRTGGPL